MARIEYVSIQEAAERLGVSADTVRRRVKRGELQGEREKTPQGFVWRVELPAAETPPEAPGALQTTPGEAIELELLRERIDELKEERDAWREQALRSGEAERELRILLRGAQELALPAKATPQDAPGATEEPAQGSGDSQEKGAFRRLWHWLRGGSTT
jgi:hypothetical protein